MIGDVLKQARDLLRQPKPKRSDTEERGRGSMGGGEGVKEGGGHEAEEGGEGRVGDGEEGEEDEVLHDDSIAMLFFLHELDKGRNSKWWCYFELLPPFIHTGTFLMLLSFIGPCRKKN